MRTRAVLVVVVALVGLVAACGVDVPDDVAEDIRGTTTTSTAPSTTETPRSDDELAQALIDNGYSEAEAECGARNLRARLDEAAIRSIIEAESIGEISGSTGRAFAQALRPCLQDGTPGEDGPGGSTEPDDPDERPDTGRPVARSEFLAGLVAGGIPESQARCITAGVYRQMSPEEISALFNAGSEDDVPDAVLDTFETISDGCER